MWRRNNTMLIWIMLHIIRCWKRACTLFDDPVTLAPKTKSYRSEKSSRANRCHLGCGGLFCGTTVRLQIHADDLIEYSICSLGPRFFCFQDTQLLSSCGGHGGIRHVQSWSWNTQGQLLHRKETAEDKAGRASMNIATMNDYMCKRMSEHMPITSLTYLV